MNRFFIPTTLFALTLFSACGNRSNKADACGVFEATEVLVSAQASGQILAFSLSEGMKLCAGVQIGYIDTIQLHLKKQQIKATMDGLKSRQTNIPKQIAAINEQIAIQKSELVRFQNLVNSQAATQKQVDDINSQIKILEKQLAAQAELLENNNTALSQERIALEAQWAQIEDQIQKSLISSPINGTVLAQYAQPGELVIHGKALFKIADMDQIVLRAYITSDKITQMKIGQTVEVLADFGTKEQRNYQGIITYISPQSEFTPKNIQTRSERDNLVYAVKISIPNDGYLKIGMYGEVIL
ncbi:MAG: HlyD family efflux transporter periplasmic adaptor subunit [Prevotellaceae bacterium]|jgi:HlyD family secretion protein|nr:HlyD family efflux transporter periplasmic adaptor subunit [Prevotellaceae bacterium]